jgi:hypothetical protein
MASNPTAGQRYGQEDCMTIPQENATPDPKQDKEYNFRLIEAKYQKEKEARLEAERKIQELASRQAPQDDEDDSNEPYVDHKKLKRKLESTKQETKKETQSEIQNAIRQALQEERKDQWLRQNNDFYEVIKHADKIMANNPELAETILQMPDNFERQKLVYNNVKAFGYHKPKEPEKPKELQQNKRSVFYTPSDAATPPYGARGDYSTQGQKSAYDKMQELKKSLRLQ